MRKQVKKLTIILTKKETKGSNNSVGEYKNVCEIEKKTLLKKKETKGSNNCVGEYKNVCDIVKKTLLTKKEKKS